VWGVAGGLIAAAVALFVAGGVLIVPANGTQSTLVTSLEFEPRFPDGTVCSMEAINLDLVTTVDRRATDVAVTSSGFEVPVLTGGPVCDATSGLLGLPTTNANLTLSYIAGDPGGINDINFVLVDGSLTVGDQFAAAVVQGGGSIIGQRSVAIGNVDAQISFDDFFGVLTPASAGDEGGAATGIEVTVGSQPARVTGEVPPGSGRALLPLGLVALALGVGVGVVGRFRVGRKRPKADVPGSGDQDANHTAPDPSAPLTRDPLAQSR
jgi:hypothetical protein